MREKEWPRGPAADAAFENIDSTHNTSSIRYRQPARCDLHGINIVDRFPSRCPLATLNPLTALGLIQDAAWRVIDRPTDDPELPDALALLDQQGVCMACMDRIRTHPTVRRLREKTGVAA